MSRQVACSCAAFPPLPLPAATPFEVLLSCPSSGCSVLRLENIPVYI